MQNRTKRSGERSVSLLQGTSSVDLRLWNAIPTDANIRRLCRKMK
jgi:hypothetical protein